MKKHKKILKKKKNVFISNIFLKCYILSEKVNISFHVILYMLQVVWILLFISVVIYFFNTDEYTYIGLFWNNGL